MCDIDWSKLYQATSKENRPTPGYVFNDIIHNVSYADPRKIPAVAEYLADCVDGDHAHVKLKALFVIKSLAYRVPPFCECMRGRLGAVQEAAAFTGPPSALFGQEPYRLVREAAEGALAALTGGEHYHEQYKEMSQRIVGFGNFQPDDDTVLPDGSVNVGRDIGVTDLALSTVGAIQQGVGSLLGSVKDMFSNPFTGQKEGTLGALGTESGDDDPDTGYDDREGEHSEPDEPQGETDEDGFYHPSAGSYVPPTVPLPVPAAEKPEDEEDWDVVHDLLADKDTSQWLEEPLPRSADAWEASMAPGPEEEASFMRVLGLRPHAEASAAEAAASMAPAEQEDLNPSEADILNILGLGSGDGPDAPAADHEVGSGPLRQRSENLILGLGSGDGPDAQAADHEVNLSHGLGVGAASPSTATAPGATCSTEMPLTASDGSQQVNLSHGLGVGAAAPSTATAPGATCSTETPCDAAVSLSHGLGVGAAAPSAATAPGATCSRPDPAGQPPDSEQSRLTALGFLEV